MGQQTATNSSSYDESSSDYENDYTSSDDIEKPTLSSDIIEITLAAHGLGNNLGAISIQYTFSNKVQCKEEHEAKEGEAL